MKEFALTDTLLLTVEARIEFEERAKIRPECIELKLEGICEGVYSS